MTTAFFSASRNLLAEWEKYPFAIPVYAVFLTKGTTVFSELQARNLASFSNLARISGTEQLVIGRISAPTPSTNKYELHAAHIISNGIINTPGSDVGSVLFYFEFGPTDSQRIPFFGDSTGFPIHNNGGLIVYRPNRLGVVNYSISGSPNPQALAGSTYSDVNGYSEVAAFLIENNPTWNGLTPSGSNQSSLPDVYAKYQLTDLGTGNVYKRDNRFLIPYTDDAIHADAVRRIWSQSSGPQNNRIIEIAAGLQLGRCKFGGTNTNQNSTAWWGPAGGTQANQFLPITGVTLRSKDPNNIAQIRGFGRSPKMTLGSNVVTVGAPGVKFEYLDITHNQGSTYCIEDDLAVGSTNFYDQFVMWYGKISGNGDWDTAHLWDAHSLIRGGHGRWDLQGVEMYRGEQHGGYINQPQGMARVVRCFNSSPTGTAGARFGWTAFQWVQRSRLDDPPGTIDPYYGGPPGYGTILMEQNSWLRTGSAAGGSTGAMTVAGFLGNVIFRDSSVLEAKGGGAVTAWCPAAGGMHTTIGQFDQGPFPAPGTAFTIKYLLVDNITFTTGTGYTNATSPLAISSCELAQIGANNLSSSQPAISFWTWSGDWQTGFPYGGPLDNGKVEFLVPPGTSPIHSQAGFNGATIKAKYGANNNPNQPGGGGNNGNLPNAQLDALEGVNNAYPPWSQGAALPAVCLANLDTESTLAFQNLATASGLITTQSTLSLSLLAQAGAQLDTESTWSGAILDGAFVAIATIDTQSIGPTITFSQPASAIAQLDTESTCGQFEPVVEPPPDVNGPPPPTALTSPFSFGRVRKGGLAAWRVGAV